ncbi:uncharacterized protein LOC132180437 [Corylus avellana]|uniref:uncharacterized protein LOC132180437 n=1 Tax=Corylus avellana TaxID=13451 RepID=UPI001E1F5714|nr:uncharacterized protein LOC132180437 [Corylus avellana]XP_059449249.1 uncharacterized protein LOC132180437 [Corylus avellana]
MAGGESDMDAMNEALSSAQIFKDKQQQFGLNPKDHEQEQNGSGVQITCFSHVFKDVTLHFQILRLPKQIYVWVGCNSAKLGHLCASAPTRPDTVSVASILGGTSDNTGSGIARRLVLKTGLNIILACNIPKNSPMLEAEAEKVLVQKLIHLGYTRRKAEGLSS